MSKQVSKTCWLELKSCIYKPHNNEVTSCLPNGMGMTDSNPGLKLGPNPLIKNYSRLPFKYKFGTSQYMLFTGRDLIFINFLYDPQVTNRYLKSDDHHRGVTWVWKFSIKHINDYWAQADYCLWLICLWTRLNIPDHTSAELVLLNLSVLEPCYL